MFSHGETLVIGKTRLFKSQPDPSLFAKVSDRIRHLKCFVLLPSRVGISIQHLTGLHFLRHPVNPDDIGRWVFADFHLELPKALIAILGYAGCHRRGVSSCNDFI